LHQYLPPFQDFLVARLDPSNPWDQLHPCSPLFLLVLQSQ
jgi:hypothetical protein